MQYTMDSIRAEFENELFNSVLPFWEKYSVDRKNGGYFNCLDREGKVFDDTKYMWLHGRQIWMFSKLYNNIGQKSDWLEIAAHGLDFMQKYAVTDDGRVYFSLNKQGKPVYLQRKIFSECFYTIALAEYGKVIGSDKLIQESKQMFEKVWAFSKDISLVGRPVFSGEAPLQTLAVPMIMLNVIEEVFSDNYNSVSDKINECIEKVKMHFVNGKMYENVLTDGNLHDSSNGRLLNPGHAIEAGWFLKHWAGLLNDDALHLLANDIIGKSFELGWDNELGGIYYFLDANGKPPLQLEWDMKLWWPHCEALYAFLLIYSETKDQEDLNRFLQVKEYVFNHFSDKKFSEWFGYLHRDGTVSMDFKGGPYKGCFHVPRALYLCLNILKKLSNENQVS